MFAFLRKLLATALYGVGWFVEACWDGVRRKSSAAERAEAIAAEAGEERQADEVAARRANETRMEALATDAVVTTMEMTQALKAARVEPSGPVGPSAEVLAERRARQARFAAEHAAATEVRSSRIVVEHDQDDGLTWRPA